jgi:CubicO group peptidase (beta-lactamase class C family)
MSLKINSVCLKSSFTVICLLFLQSIFAQSGFTQLDDFLVSRQKQLGTNAVALVYKDGKIIYQKALGQDFNGKTQAPIYSSSKWLTAAMTMILVDEGKISLDDPVVKYVPIFRSYMKNYITIRHCLSQTSGIEGDKGGLAKIFQRKKFEALDDEVKAIAAREIANAPGKEFNYSNLGAEIVGRVLEVVTKKSFDRLIAERLLRPLKMRGTNFVEDDGGAVNPAGGAKSTANDFINFLSMLLSKGMFEGRRILSEASVEEMMKPQFAEATLKFVPEVTKGFHYGLGEWIQEEDANGKSTTVSCPSLFGTWPYIDKCRNYAAIIFVSKKLDDEKRDVALGFKEIVDGIVGGGCK